MLRIIVSAILFIMFIVSAPSYATQLELVCPCGLKNVGLTGLEVTAGVENIEDQDSSDFRFQVIFHATPSPDDSDFVGVAGIYRFSTILRGRSRIGSNVVRVGFVVPPDTGIYYYTLRLQENVADRWIQRDQVRMSTPIEIVDGGQSQASLNRDSYGALYFNGTPSVALAGGEVVISLPEIINSSVNSSGPLTLRIVQTESPTGFVFTNARTAVQTFSLTNSIGARSSFSARDYTRGFTQTGTARNFFHLLIEDTALGDPLLYETVINLDKPLPTRNFSISGIELFEDNDNDGVGNYNERLTGTDPDDASSVPGPTVIDALVLYSPGVTDLYGVDPSSRIDQLIAVANTTFSNSNLDVSVRVAASIPQGPETISKSLGSTSLLDSHFDQIVDRRFPFTNLNSLLETHGADIILVLRTASSLSTTCSVSYNGGVGARGDFISEFGSRNSIVVADIDDTCPDATIARGIGRLLGLSSSGRGTFPWSVGYGVDNNFITMMITGSSFINAPRLLRFSNPNDGCLGLPCGVDRSDPINGADAFSTIKLSQYQVAAYRRSLTEDTDRDGVINTDDPDDDNDGVPDVSDAFPFDATEFVDTDGDGIGNNADTDDDNDQVLDVDDALPLDSSDHLDADGDGIGDSRDIPIKLGASQVVELPMVGKTLTSSSGASLVIPPDATAVSVNVTVVNPSGNGFITVWPCGVSRPLASNLNYSVGDVRPNGVIASIGRQGSVCFYSQSETDLIVDVAGWFVGNAFTGATPKRLVDTRDGTGGQLGKLKPDSPLSISIANLAVRSASGADLTIAHTIDAVALNVTVVNPEASGFVTVYPCDVARPLASNVNYSAGQVVANGVISPISASGHVCIYSQVATEVVVDLAGWFPKFETPSFRGAVPKRVVDTRDGTGGSRVKLDPSHNLTVPIHGVTLTIGGVAQVVPPVATAAALNVTIVNAEASGFATVWPCSAARPLASNLNFTAGQVVANNVIAPIGNNGNVCFFSNVPVDIIVDISGYFSGSGADVFVGSTPRRFLDTRDGFGPPPR